MKSYSTPLSHVPHKYTPCVIVIILQLSTYQLRIRRHQLCCNRSGQTGKYVVATSKFLGFRHRVSGRRLVNEQYGGCITTRLMPKEFYGPQSSQVIANEAVHCILRNKNCVHIVNKDNSPKWCIKIQST